MNNGLPSFPDWQYQFKNEKREIGMKTTSINKAKLLGIIKDNRAIHVAEYEAALVKFQEKVIEEFGKKKSFFSKNPPTANVLVSIPAPISNVKEYDKVIRKLELEESDVVDLDDREFENFVQDEWSWSALTKSINSSYIAS